MYKNRAKDGSCNICGKRVAELRKALTPRTSQNDISHELQLMSIDLDKNAIQRIEAGKRFVTDIELRGLAKIFGVTTDSLLNEDSLD